MLFAAGIAASLLPTLTTLLIEGVESVGQLTAAVAYGSALARGMGHVLLFAAVFIIVISLVSI